MRRCFAVTLIAVLVVGVIALCLPGDAYAKPGKGKGPKPPKCDHCAPTVGDCVLDSCSTFDCVYVCPFP